MIAHSTRAHSKFSASGSDRWLNCAASVALEEKSPPSPDSPWSKEGTFAHEVLELMNLGKDPEETLLVQDEMLQFCRMVSNKMKAIAKKEKSKLEVECRVYNKSIHPEMFGTCDGIIAPEYYLHLHIIDFKYGQGHIVDPKNNTQLIQYALGAAEKYDWDFNEVTMHIMQPRAGSDWHKSWTITKEELQMKWLPLWHSGVKRVESGKAKPFEGNWCHWCRAKRLCSLKIDKAHLKITNAFLANPITEEEENEKSKKGFKKSPGKKVRKESDFKNPFRKSSDEENFDESFGGEENPKEESEESFESFTD